MRGQGKGYNIFMILQIYTDGGSKGNPGPAAIGIAYFVNGTKVDTHREDIGTATNNEAEYTTLIRALELVQGRSIHTTHSIDKIAVLSDSRLMVNQLKGLFKVKEARIREFIMKIRILESEIGLPVEYINIPREQNTVADALVNNKTE